MTLYAARLWTDRHPGLTAGLFLIAVLAAGALGSVFGLGWMGAAISIMAGIAAGLNFYIRTAEPPQSETVSRLGAR